MYKLLERKITPSVACGERNGTCGGQGGGGGGHDGGCGDVTCGACGPCAGRLNK